MCLQKLNPKIDYNFDKINALINELEAKKIITAKEAKSIDARKVLEFTKSKIWEELKFAKEIEQEKPFYINLPAQEFFEEQTDENILVQGIIDLYYIDKDDKLKLVDYKTDYVKVGNENELREKYKTQIELYSRALEKAFGKKVDERYLYSVYLGKEIPI